MESIDRLREYALTAASVNATTRAVLAGYIEKIEREVKALVDERDLLKTQWEAGVDFDQRLEACADNREDVTLFGVDYTPLPVDADGEYIHIGDVMEWVRYKDDDPTIVRTVSGIGNGVFFAWSDEQGRYAQYEAHAYRHYHAPTVEDVLREFAEKVTDSQIPGVHPTYEEAIADYANRLTLAEGEDA